MKKIVIDLRLYGAKDAGLGRYNQQFLSELIKQNMSEQFILLVSEKLHIDLPSNFSQVQVPYRWYSLSEQIYLPRLLSKIKADIVHFTHFNVPFFYNKPFIVTIHDLVMNHFADRSTTTRSKLIFWLKRIGYLLTMSHAVRKSKKIITVSNFVKRDIVTTYNISESKISVIYEGVSVLDSNITAPEVPEKYILYVGNAYPHKDLPTLLKAFEIVQKNNAGLKLIFVGHQSYFYKKLLNNIPSHLVNNVIHKADVSDEQLPYYYKNASCLVFPSLYEGFGLPGLEALSFGCPVVAAQAGSLPEIMGDKALYFTPGDDADCAAKIDKLINDKSLSIKMLSSAQEYLRQFSWQKCANETLKEIRNLL